jgi:hypothetical protein
MWNKLLLRVWHWWISGICWMALGDMMLFDAVTTLGGGVVTTL